MPLTDRAIQNEKPRMKTFKLYDCGGLYLEVAPPLWRQMVAAEYIPGRDNRHFKLNAHGATRASLLLLIALQQGVNSVRIRLYRSKEVAIIGKQQSQSGSFDRVVTRAVSTGMPSRILTRTRISQFCGKGFPVRFATIRS